MKVLVKKVEVKRGNSRVSGEPYLFTNAFVVFDDNKTADYVTIDSEVCHPDKIKPGMKAELYFSQANQKRVTYFEPMGAKDEAQPEGGYTEVNAADYDLDPATGEMVEKNKNKK